MHERIPNVSKFSADLFSVLKKMGLTQKHLAEDLDVSTAAMSKFFNPIEGDSGVGLEKQMDIFQAIENHLLRIKYSQKCLAKYTPPVGKKMQSTELQADRQNHLRTELLAEMQNPGGHFFAFPEGRIEKLFKTANRLNSADITQLKEKFQNIRKGLHEVTTVQVLAVPGGMLPHNASNYVQRLDDDIIEDILQNGSAAASIIIAPVNGGTSSFLRRVYDLAAKIDGCSVKIIHMENGFPDGNTYNQYDFFKYLFGQIGVPKEALKDETLDSEDLRDAFEHWAKDEWIHKSSVVLVIDGLDQVFKTAKSLADALALVNWMSSLRNAIAYGEEPFGKMVLFSALTGKTFSAAHASPFATQAMEINLGKLNENQVRELASVHDITLNEGDFEKLWELFHGHPYLTHLFVWSMYNNSSFDDAEEEALSLEGRYETHWDRLLHEVDFLVGGEPELTNIQEMTHEISKKETLNELSKEALKLYRAYGASLRAFGLLDGTKSEPTVCKFYLNAIKEV